MSNLHNERWLEGAHECFEEALMHEDYALAKAIADDVADKGFREAGITMGRRVLAEKLHVKNV